MKSICPMATQTLNNNSENGMKMEEFSETDPLRQLNEPKERQNEEIKRTFKENCSYVMKNITVEPTMFLFIFAVVTGVLTSQNLNLEKACRVNLNFTTEICDALKAQTLGEQNIYERDVQRLVAAAMAWRTYITATIPCLLALFIGSWSDKTGHRKIFMFTPIIGQILVNINGVINTYFFYELSLEVIVFSEAVLDGLSGSWCVIFLSIFAYISAITTNENRTFRMGLISFSLTVGFPIGMGLSGTLLKSFGYYGCYGLVTCLHFINLVYICFILKDPERTPEQKLVSSTYK